MLQTRSLQPALRYVLVCAVGLACAGPGAQAAEPATPELDHFRNTVEPLLRQHCFACHSHAAGKIKGGLTLDSRSGWAKGGESGPAIVPGQPEASLLLKTVHYTDDAPQMPPQGKLPATAIASLTTWIRQGAIDPRVEPRPSADLTWDDTVRRRRDWWSLQPVRQTPLPAVRDTHWSQHPVDRFVLARLEAAQLQPAAPADCYTLARRLSFALHGLPPNRRDVEQFVNDPAPDAYERLVDRWLAAPQFGERWARHWMDVVHYADTHGYEWDIPAKGAWQYRDYLIRAFNDDVSFRQLIVEHLAGDLLQPPRLNEQLGLNESILGTIALRLGERRHGDSAEFDGIHQEAIDNVIDTVSKAFQATTVACAHCHDHKLDAIGQRDYYALAGVLMSSRWVCRSAAAHLPTTEQLAPLRAAKAEIKQLLARQWLDPQQPIFAGVGLYLALDRWLNTKPDYKRLSPENPLYLLSKISAGLRENRVCAEVWNELSAEYTRLHRERVQQNLERFQPLADFTGGQMPAGWHGEGFGLAHGFTRNGDLVVASQGPLAVRELLPAGLFTHVWSARWGGALRSPLLAAEVKSIACEAIGTSLASRQLMVDNAMFPESRFKYLEQPHLAWLTTAALPDDVRNGRRIWLELNTKDFNNYYPSRVGLTAKYTPEQQRDPRSWFGVTRVYAGPAGAAAPADELARFLPLFAGDAPTDAARACARLRSWVTDALERWAADRATTEDVQLINWLLEHEELPQKLETSGELTAAVERYRTLEAALPTEPVVGAVADYREGRDERLGLRGSYTELGDVVPRGYIGFLSGGETQATADSGRLQLAQVIASANNPLTARTFVNRVWHYLWGAGLVNTVDDFGHLGEQPSHPELLDDLATRFVHDGWSLKRLVRLLVTSKTWQQSGTPHVGAIEHDPDNRLWHHTPLRRLEAEALRDSILAVSGRLDMQLYGPPIDPWRIAEDKDKRLFAGPLDGDGRRSVYIKMTLMEPPRFLAEFNQPVPKLTNGRRDVTNVPSQALTMLNDPFVTAMAELWARRLVVRQIAGEQVSTTAERCDEIFVTAFARPATEAERQRLQQLVKQLQIVHAVDDRTLLTSVPVWKDVAHAVFNMKEFLYVR